MSESKSGANRGFAGMLKLGIILALYSAVACVGLAFVYAGTEKVIAQRQQADLEASLSELFPDADDFRAISDLKSPDPAVTIEDGGSFVAIKNGAVTGLIVRTSRASYGGPIKVLVGIGVDDKISAVKILEHTDTPGLGANAAKPAFYNQFAGKAVSDAFVPKQDVVAITAATITSRAVAASVKAAGEAALAWFAATGGSR